MIDFHKYLIVKTKYVFCPQLFMHILHNVIFVTGSTLLLNSENPAALSTLRWTQGRDTDIQRNFCHYMSGMG